MFTPTEYLAKFDSDGRRAATVPVDPTLTDERKAELLADEYISITAADWNYYVGNKGTGDNGTGYVRGKDGKPVSAPAHVATTEEKLFTLESTYKADKAQLADYYLSAAMAGDTDTQAEIKAELEELDAQYAADVKAAKEA